MPKRLRYFLPDAAALHGVVVRILLRAIERCLREHSPGRSAAARLGAVVFIHRFGAALNAHLHFHCCILEGAFAAAGATDGAVVAATPPGDNAPHWAEAAQPPPAIEFAQRLTW